MNEAVVVTIPIVVGVVASVRQAWDLPSRVLPVWSLVVGILLSLFASGWTAQAAMEGLIVGLSASGLYAGTKAVWRG